MFARILRTAAAALVAGALSGGSALAATEGKEYAVLEKPIPNAQGTLVKVFSYDCPFCYRYDRQVTPVVVPRLPASLTFRPFHLKTKGKYGPQASELFAVLIVKDQAAGVALTDEKSLFKKAKMAYYNAYHDKKERWDAGPDAFLATGLEKIGMSRADFDKAKEDPKVKALLAEWEASYEIAKIQGVPGFVVNGKYLLYTKAISSIDGMVATIDELAKK